jgi:hypothetical protein
MAMRPSIWLAFLLALSPRSSGAAGLEKQWEVNVGPAARLEAAVCPDGVTVVSDGEGRLVGVDSGGRVAFDQRFAELGLVWALACDGERLLAASGEALQVHVFARRPGGAPVLRATHPVPLPGSRIVAAPDGGFWILSHGAGPSRVHKIGRDGTLEHSTALEDLGLNPHSAPMAPLAKQGALLVVAPSLYAMQAVDRAGKAAAALPSPSRDFTTRPVGQQSDEVVNVVPLPDGRFAAHLSKARYVRPDTFQNYQVLEILDAGLRVERTGIPITRGALRGADAEGNLYFASMAPNRDVFVVKARLHE